jgi:hypothetical protein
MEYLDFAIDFNTGLVMLKRDILSSANTSDVSRKLFESSKIVNTIPLNTFNDIIRRSIGATYSSPMLPYGTVFFKETESYFLLALKVKEFPFKFYHTSYKKLDGCTAYFPDSYLLFVIPSSALLNPEKGIPISKTYILVEDNPLNYFSIDKNYLSSPFPNFASGYGTGICWGGGGSSQYIWSKNIVDLRSLETAPHKYVSSSFNNDLSPEIKPLILYETIIIFLTSDKVAFDSYNDFLNSKGLLGVECAKLSKPEDIKDLRYYLVHYSFLCWYGETYKSYPSFTFSSLPSYDSSVSKIIQNPLR